MPRHIDLKEIKNMRMLQRINQTGLLLVSILVLIPLNTGLAAEEGTTDTSDKAVQQEESSDTFGGIPVDPGYVYDPTGMTDPFFSFLSLREQKETEERQVIIREEYVDFKGEKQYREIIKASPSL